jgi:hypothetical protein
LLAFQGLFALPWKNGTHGPATRQLVFRQDLPVDLRGFPEEFLRQSRWQAKKRGQKKIPGELDAAGYFWF